MSKKNDPTYPNEQFTPLSTEYDQTHTVNLEEFPEGSYGAPLNLQLWKDDWKDDMHSAPLQAFEARSFHEGIPRQDPAAHEMHDNPEKRTQEPYVVDAASE